MTLGILTLTGCSAPSSTPTATPTRTADEILAATARSLASVEGFTYAAETDTTLLDTPFVGSIEGTVSGDNERYVLTHAPDTGLTDFDGQHVQATEYIRADRTFAMRFVDREAGLCTAWISDPGLSPMVNFLSADTYVSLLTSATPVERVGAERLGEEDCEHVSIALPWVDYTTILWTGTELWDLESAAALAESSRDDTIPADLWVDTGDNLPRRLVVSSPEGGDIVYEFLDWGSQPLIPAPTDFRPLPTGPGLGEMDRLWPDE